METTDTQVTSHDPGDSSGHGTAQGTPGWLGGRRGLVIAAGVALAATALALGQHWLAAADLVPLLFVLPCAAMMFMCMKGNHGEQTNATPASTQSKAPSITNTRN